MVLLRPNMDHETNPGEAQDQYLGVPERCLRGQPWGPPKTASRPRHQHFGASKLNSWAPWPTTAPPPETYYGVSQYQHLEDPEAISLGPEARPRGPPKPTLVPPRPSLGAFEANPWPPETGFAVPSPTLGGLRGELCGPVTNNPGPPRPIVGFPESWGAPRPILYFTTNTATKTN